MSPLHALEQMTAGTGPGVLSPSVAEVGRTRGCGLLRRLGVDGDGVIAGAGTPPGGRRQSPLLIF